jgi:hypothetical protein
MDLLALQERSPMSLVVQRRHTPFWYEREPTKQSADFKLTHYLPNA